MKLINALITLNLYIFCQKGEAFCTSSYDPPRSANTEYTMCIEICDGTYESQDTPHPVYTDGYGTPVTQLNMVVLGGPNGLNN